MLHCETGLHIGAGKGSLEIGGADNPVVKDAFGRPYIPGSSLRGRLRSLLEHSIGLAIPSELVYLSSAKARRFAFTRATARTTRSAFCSGVIRALERVSGEASEAATRRLRGLRFTMRRSMPESITPQMRENLDDELTEVKSENAVDRITSQANPRTLERVPAGARFQVRMVLDILCDADGSCCARRAKDCACWKTTLWAAAVRAGADASVSPG